MVDLEEEYIKKHDDTQESNSLNSPTSLLLNFLSLVVTVFYIIVIGSVYLQFVPILNQNWFSLGTGKFIGIAAIFGIYCILIKNYFAAFFISLFSSFFVFHEVIIYYDNYAIELGQELGSNGTFRFVFEIFANAFNLKYGAFWAVFGSLVSLLIISFAWITNTINENKTIENRA